MKKCLGRDNLIPLGKLQKQMKLHLSSSCLLIFICLCGVHIKCWTNVSEAVVEEKFKQSKPLFLHTQRTFTAGPRTCWDGISLKWAVEVLSLPSFPICSTSALSGRNTDKNDHTPRPFWLKCLLFQTSQQTLSICRLPLACGQLDISFMLPSTRKTLYREHFIRQQGTARECMGQRAGLCYQSWNTEAKYHLWKIYSLFILVSQASQHQKPGEVENLWWGSGWMRKEEALLAFRSELCCWRGLSHNSIRVV